MAQGFFEYIDGDGDQFRMTKHADGVVVFRVREARDRWRYVAIPAEKVAEVVEELKAVV